MKIIYTSFFNIYKNKIKYEHEGFTETKQKKKLTYKTSGSDLYITS